MKLCFLFFILCLLPGYGIAQSSIEGRIWEDTVGTPAVYASMTLLGADSSLIKREYANEKGRFALEQLPAGSYLLKVSYLGFADYFSPPLHLDSLMQLQLEPIVLQTAVGTLKEVAILASIPDIEFKKGAIVLHVEHNPLTAGNTVLELIKKLPGVVMDDQNNLTVNGKSGIRFMLDGRLQQMPWSQMMTLLDAMSAESVSSLELIKNPPAKYDAAGTAGLINIITKKTKVKGFNGSFTESAAMGKRFGSGSMLSLNFKSDRWTLFTNSSFTQRNPMVAVESDRSLDWGMGMQQIHSVGRVQSHNTSLNFNGGLEYDMSARTTLGLSLQWMPGQVQDNYVFTTDLTSGPYRYMNYITNSKDKFNSPSVGVYLIHHFDTMGTELSVSADYTHYWFGESRLNHNYFQNEQLEPALPMLAYRNAIDLDIEVFTQKLDFTKRLSKTITLETGVKASFVQNNSGILLERNQPGIDVFYPDSIFSNTYDYRERIFAAYVNLIKSYKKMTLQTGLRAEQTDIEGIGNSGIFPLKRNYLNFFPNVSLDLRPNEKHNIQFTYSYRIDRPSYDQLNAVKIFNSELNYGTGNPELKPQYSHNGNIDFNDRNIFIHSLSYTHTNNSIYSYQYSQEQSGILVDTLFNFASRNLLSYSLTLQQQWATWYSMQLYGIVAYASTKGTIQNMKAHTETLLGFVSANNEFHLPGKYQLQLNARYSAPMRDAIQKYSSRSSVDVALQKRFLKDKLNVVLGLYDIFYADKGSITTELPGQSSYMLARNDTRRIRLTLTYSFGNMRITRKKSEEQEAEAKRIKKGN